MLRFPTTDTETVISGPKYVMLTAYFSRHFPEKEQFLTDVILEFPNVLM